MCPLRVKEVGIEEVGVGVVLALVVHPEGKSRKQGFPNNHPEEESHSVRWLTFKQERRVTAILHFTGSLEQYSDHLDRPD